MPGVHEDTCQPIRPSINVKASMYTGSSAAMIQNLKRYRRGDVMINPHLYRPNGPTRPNSSRACAIRQRISSRWLSMAKAMFSRFAT